MKILRLLLLLLVIGEGPRLSLAEPVVILTSAQDEYPLGRVLDYLEDPSGELTIDDVASPAFAARFVRSQVDAPNFGYTASAYWVRIRLRCSIAHDTEWRLELGFANIQHIECYRPRADQSGFEVIRTGAQYPFVTREIPYYRFVFALSLPPAAKQTIYLRFQSEASMTFPLTLRTPDAFMRHSQRTFFLSGLFYGALLLLIAYNAFLWLALRDRTYGYYVGGITCTILMQWVYDGWAGQYLWPNAPRWTEVAIPLLWGVTAILVQMFAITFLNTRARAPRGHRMMIGTIALWIISIALIPFVSYGVLARMMMLLRIFTSIFLPGISLFIWRRGYQPARYFCLAWLMTTSSLLPYILSRLGAAPSVALTEHSYQFGIVLTGLLFSFALADRIQVLRQEKDAAQRQVLTAFQEKERMIAEQNIRLEQNVYARTRELQQEVAERQKTEIELQRAKDQAETANRAKSLFLSNMSHELRTPLNAILGYAQLLKPGAPPGSLESTGLETIERSGRHLVQLIEDLLDLAKIEAQKIELVPGVFSLLNQLETLSNMMRLRADQKGLNFVYAPQPGLPNMVFGDEKRLSQVLLNLLGNAVKFTEQGTVTLRVKTVISEQCSVCSKHPQNEHFQLNTDYCSLVFEVEDTGPGIPSDHLEHIFVPFAQLQEAGKPTEGIGLGLSISRILVQLMGDDLHVTSTLGAGSVFWFTLTLPAVAVSPPPSQPGHRTIIGVRGTPPRLLIVDDHADNRAMLHDHLQPLGFVIAEAENGQGAIEQAERDRPDLVLMDLMMPVLNGFETTRRMRQSPTLGGLKILMMTANLTINAADLIADIGCDEVLTKPLQLDLLLDRLREHLKIEWIYDEPVPTATPAHAPTVLPPEADLTKLRHLAQICAFTQLMEELNCLSQQDQQYEPFANSLLQLLNTFQFDAILERLGPA